MAISIDWGAKIIQIPRADLTLLQSVPTEIRELNLNEFRLILKDLEDSEAGIVFLDTHRHNTEVLLGGLTYARVVEIINGYTITFEDGQYAVNLVGANSNVGDVVNVNQVSVRSSNSAGLTSTPAVEYASFEGGVTIDELSSVIGTVYPTGTALRPVNNVADALLIASARGLKDLFFRGNFSFDSDDDIEGYHIFGQGMLTSEFTFASGVTFTDCRIHDATITGAMVGGNVELYNCWITEVEGIYGELTNCRFHGSVRIAPDEYFSAVGLVAEGDDVVVDLQGSSATASFDVDSGKITFKNAGPGSLIELNVKGAEIILDSTCTGGQYYIEGFGSLENNSTMALKGNHLLNALAISEELMNTIAEDGVSVGDTLRLMLSIMTGQTSGGGTATLTFKNIGGTKNRLVVTVDENGNRTAIITRDGT